MAQHEITDPKPRRSATELAEDAALKARRYRRKATLAEHQDLARLARSLGDGLRVTAHREGFDRVFAALDTANLELNEVLNKMSDGN